MLRIVCCGIEWSKNFLDLPRGYSSICQRSPSFACGPEPSGLEWLSSCSSPWYDDVDDVDDVDDNEWDEDRGGVVAVCCLVEMNGVGRD